MGSRSLDLVDQILCDLPPNTVAQANAVLPSYEDAMSARDEIEDLGARAKENGTFRALDDIQLSEVLQRFDNATVQQSIPFGQLREDLRRFTFPSMKTYIRELLQPSLPPTNLTPIYSVSVQVEWELRNFLVDQIGATDNMEDMLTLTGDFKRSQALPCGAYMSQTWPETGVQTLAAVNHVLKMGSSCT